MSFSGTYVLEVLKKPKKQFSHLEYCGGVKHVGYMRAVFDSKERAAAYYAKYNPEMRQISASSRWKSDWDPETRLLYIVRENHGVELTVPPFNEKHEPKIDILRDSTGEITGVSIEFPAYSKYVKI